MSSHLADLLVSALRDLRAAEYERVVYRTWLIAAIEELHDQRRELETARRTLAHLHDERRGVAAERIGPADPDPATTEAITDASDAEQFAEADRGCAGATV